MTPENTATMRQYYNDLGMTVTGGTLNCQLYLDLDTGKLSINHEANSNSWLQRPDGTLVCLHKQDTNPDWGNADDADSGDYQSWVDDVLDEYIDRVA